MARKPYGEFSVIDRHISSRLYRLDVRRGFLPAAVKEICEACLQSDGQIENHREDYSRCDATGLIILCYRCHRILHMRDNNPEAWDDYREAVRRGYQWHATRNFGIVIGQNMKGRTLPDRRTNAPRERTVLDDVNDGVYLSDPPDVRAARMAAMYERYRELEAEGLVKRLDEPVHA